MPRFRWVWGEKVSKIWREGGLWILQPVHACDSLLARRDVSDIKGLWIESLESSKTVQSERATKREISVREEGLKWNIEEQILLYDLRLTLISVEPIKVTELKASWTSIESSLHLSDSLTLHQSFLSRKIDNGGVKLCLKCQASIKDS
jgi:hypothetical protein